MKYDLIVKSKIYLYLTYNYDYYWNLQKLYYNFSVYIQVKNEMIIKTKINEKE